MRLALGIHLESWGFLFTACGQLDSGLGDFMCTLVASKKSVNHAVVPQRVPVSLQRLQDDEMGDDPLLDELKLLRRRIFHWHGEI